MLGDDSKLAGALRWPVKRSFVSYVLALFDGEAAISDEVRVNEDEFVFPLTATRDSGNEQIFQFSGELRFVGHAGLLAVRLADPRLTIAPGSCTISVEDRRDRRTDLVRLGDAQPVDLCGSMRWDDVRLLSGAVPIFGENYIEGARFDPVSLEIRPCNEGS